MNGGPNRCGSDFSRRTVTATKRCASMYDTYSSLHEHILFIRIILNTVSWLARHAALTYTDMCESNKPIKCSMI